MRVCIPCSYPGGLDGVITAPFEECDLLEYFETTSDGRIEHTAQTRNCLAGCVDPVEAIVRRGVESMAVISISPASLMRLRNQGVRVFRASNPAVKVTVEMLVAGMLEEIGIDEFSRMRKR